MSKKDIINQINKKIEQIRRDKTVGGVQVRKFGQGTFFC